MNTDLCTNMLVIWCNFNWKAHDGNFDVKLFEPLARLMKPTHLIVCEQVGKVFLIFFINIFVCLIFDFSIYDKE
jgi:hypothetical protein